MAKKQKKQDLKRPSTKRQLSHLQRQRRIQRITRIAGITFLALIIAFIGYGYYADQVKPLNQPVLKVNDTVFNMRYYTKVLALYSQGQDPSVISFVADMTISRLEQNELVRQGVANLEISVNTEEINSRLDELNLPNTKVNRNVVEAELLTSKLLDDHFDLEVPTSCEQVQTQAMFLESEEVAQEMIDRLAEGDSFASLTEEFSTETQTKQKSGDMGWLPKDFSDVLLGDLGNSMLEEIAFGLEAEQLSEPTYDESVAKAIGYWLIEVLERDENQGTHARGILLGSRQEAKEIRARLEAGEDFVALVQEYSQHPMSKELEGDLGWIQEVTGNKAVTEVALQLEPGILSEPIADESLQTQGGYWLVKAVDKDANRQLEDPVREQLKSIAFDDWLSEQKEKSTIENYMDEEQKSWAIAQVMKDKE